MVSTIDHLIAERLIEPHEEGWQLTATLNTIKVGVPDSIRQLIETQVDRLDAAISAFSKRQVSRARSS